MFSNTASWLRDNRIQVFIFGFIGFSFIMTFLDFLFWSDNRWTFADILVEMHGLWFDVFFFGVLLAIYEFYEHRNKDIKRYNEELNILRGWHDNEAAQRVRYFYKKLVEKGEDVSLENLHIGKLDKKTILRAINNKINIGSLGGATLEGVEFNSLNSLKPYNFECARLVGSKFINLHFNEALFEEANLSNSTFSNVRLFQGNFHGAQLFEARFTNSLIGHCNFNHANLYKVHFNSTNLEYPSFLGSNLNEAIFHSGISIKNVDFRYCTFYDAMFEEGIEFDKVKVESPNWFNKLQQMNVRGLEYISKDMYINPDPEYDELGNEYYIVVSSVHRERGFLGV